MLVSLKYLWTIITDVDMVYGYWSRLVIFKGNLNIIVTDHGPKGKAGHLLSQSDAGGRVGRRRRWQLAVAKQHWQAAWRRKQWK